MVVSVTAAESITTPVNSEGPMCVLLACFIGCDGSRAQGELSFKFSTLYAYLYFHVLHITSKSMFESG